MPRSDLNPAEQEHVRALLRVLRVKLGNWHSVERALPLSHSSLWSVVSGRAEVTATIAFRVARTFDASISAVLTGQALPPGTCKHCGHVNFSGGLIEIHLAASSRSTAAQMRSLWLPRGNCPPHPPLIPY